MIITRKSMIMLVCALMIISSAAFGTIAYLTDTEVMTNRFTVGKVDIVVDETQVDENGEPVPNPQEDPANPDDDYLRIEKENKYPLIPGGQYVKDPTMTVKAGSEESYVRMLVTIQKAAEIDAIFAQLKTQYPNGFVPGEFVTDRDNEKWIYTGTMEEDEEENTYTLEFRYVELVKPSATEDEVLPSLFKTIRIPGELTNEHLAQLEEFSIDIVGHAIQKTGFADADAAWAAFDEQPTETGADSAQP